MMTEKSLLIKEIDSLPPRYYGEVIDFVGYIKEKEAKKSLSFEQAAEEYRNDKETKPEMTWREIGEAIQNCDEDLPGFPTPVKFRTIEEMNAL